MIAARFLGTLLGTYDFLEKFFPRSYSFLLYGTLFYLLCVIAPIIGVFHNNTT